MIQDFKKADTVNAITGSNNHDIPEEIDESENPEESEPEESLYEYTVIEEFESLDNDEIDSSLTKISKLLINPGHFVPVVPEGFVFDKRTFDDEVLRIQYKRKRVTLYFNPNGGEWDLTEDVHELKGKYGERLPLIDITQIERFDAKFAGWTENPDEETVTTVRIPEFYPAEDHTYYAVWDAVNSNYIVKIYEENLDYPEDASLDQKYTLVAMNAASGIPGEKSNYKAISRYGFEAVPFGQIIIGEFDEPSEVLKVYYNRRIFTYKFDLDAAYAKWKNKDGQDHNDDHADRYVYGKYESDFTEYGCIECFRDERTGLDNNGEELHGDLWNFEGWNEVGGKVDIKFTQDREYVAVWDQGEPEYTIKHVFEQADGNYAEDPRYPDEKYSAGSEIYTKAQAYDGVPGYYALPFEQQEVNVDSLTVIEIKYNRATVTVTMNANGGNFNCGEQIVKISGKYLDPIPTLPPAPVKEHHDFVKWQSVHGDLPANPTFPAKNIRYEAVYNRTGAVYGVEYYLENVDDDNYSMNKDDTVTKVGDYNETTLVPVTFDVKSFKGFEFDHAYLGKTGSITTGLTVSDDEENITINDGIAYDDSTVVRVYLNRKRFNVTFDPNGLIWNSEGKWNEQDNEFKEDVSPRTLTNLKYGTRINAVREDFHSKDKRDVFDYWSPVFTGVVTAEPVQEYKAITKSMTVQYTVRYLFETIDCPKEHLVYVQDPAFPDDTTGRELPGFRTQVVIPASDFEKGGRFEGFRMNNADNKNYDIIVSENISDNIVEIHLDRREIELEFVANRNNEENAKWPNGVGEFDNRLNRVVKGKFGAPVDLLEKVEDLNEVKWIAEKGDDGKLMKFDGWETEGDENGEGIVKVDVTAITTFPSGNMKYYAKWEEIESTQATNKDENGSGSGIIDSAANDIELSKTLVSGNTYRVTVKLPFENSGEGLKKWTVSFMQQNKDEDFVEVKPAENGVISKEFTVGYFDKTISVKAEYEGLAVPFSKDITLKVNK
ncbi:MAG: InlB B-repeat-containing protein [Treponema sp.]|nr:InlB B-repeat-containing protein [Treponema sp.]